MTTKTQFVVSFWGDGVPQARCIIAENLEIAKEYFVANNPNKIFVGIRQDSTDYSKRGMPVEIVPDGWKEKEM